MQKDQNLLFIKEKIYELNTAVMYTSSNALVKLGNDLVTVLKVDDEGQLWYIANRPLQESEYCEQNFPARLFFYRKGTDYTVEVSGNARIVNNDDPSLDDKKILVKMNMVNIEYTEPHFRKPKSKIEALIENGYSWLLNTISIPRLDINFRKFGN
jgi:hypothetical protein